MKIFKISYFWITWLFVGILCYAIFASQKETYLFWYSLICIAVGIFATWKEYQKSKKG